MLRHSPCRFDHTWPLLTLGPAPLPCCRYGNPAFRTWHARLVERAPALLAPLLPAELAGALPELAPYLCDACGNPTRIDYGTGDS